MSLTITLQPGQSTTVTVGGQTVATVTAAPAQPQPQPPGSRELLYGYFLADAAQPAQTADHVNVVHCPSGGDWSSTAGRQAVIDAQITVLRNARAAGIRRGVLTSDFAGFADLGGGRRQYLGQVEAQTRLEDFIWQVYKAGLLDMIVGLYTVDEPGREAQVPSGDLASFCADLRSVWKNLFPPTPPPMPKLCIVYGDEQDYRAIGAHDACGIDAYGQGIGVLSGLYQGMQSLMTAAQRTIILPGVASPWRENPGAWVDYALSVAKVWWVCPFDFIGYDGQANGARDNGMLPVCRTAGMRVKALTP